MVIQNAHVVDYLNWIHVLPIMFIVECRAIIDISKHSPISFKHVSFMMFPRRSSPIHIPIKYRNLIKKMDHLRPHLPQRHDEIIIPTFVMDLSAQVEAPARFVPTVLICVGDSLTSYML